MCAGDDSQTRSEVFSRGDFLAVAAGVAGPLFAAPGHSDADAVASAALPPAPAGLSPGDTFAAALAARSDLAKETYTRVALLARSIGDAVVRESVVALISDPRPIYARHHASDAARSAVRDALAAAGFVAADAPVAGIFPPGSHPEVEHAVQPFWSAPGSSDGSHHAYPGGLAVHEYFNAALAEQFAQTYDRHYFAGASTVDRDTVVAAALYHDICKTVVFGWNADGTPFAEATIAGTGAHHVLSGAEAIARGRTPRFVITQLSAHAAPSLGDETKVVAWCRAAAIIAGVDPIAYGLSTSAGFLATQPVPLEAFISHLSDHDYVLSVHAMHVVDGRLRARYAAPSERPKPVGVPDTFAWYRNAVLTRTTAIALYDTLARNGEAAFELALRRAEVDLWPATERRRPLAVRPRRFRA